MNRAALAARMFLAISVLPTAGAAGYAVYEFRHQPAAATAYRPHANAAVSAHFPSTKGAQLGVFAPTLPSSGRTVSDTTGLKSFDAAVHHGATLTVAYINWGSPFPAGYIRHAARVGARTVLELEPRGKGVPKLPQIVAGRGDGWLKEFAAAIAETRIPFTLSFGPEMNGSWYAYGSRENGARDYIQAYRYVHDKLIKDVGHYLSPARAAGLITFMWQPSAIHVATPSPIPYWPGAKYVNLVGLDGYYYHTTDTFHIIFAHTIRLLRKLSPKTRIMIGETAVGPMTGHQAAGIKDLFAGIKHSKLAGLIWFNRDQTKISYGKGKRIYHQDWRLQDHPAALRAFIKGLRADGFFVRLLTAPIGSR
jgi:mannan endo-1,4-beta-mannosidase